MSALRFSSQRPDMAPGAANGQFSILSSQISAYHRAGHSRGLLSIVHALPTSSLCVPSPN